jgi:DnaK suppressor protein
MFLRPSNLYQNEEDIMKKNKGKEKKTLVSKSKKTLKLIKKIKPRAPTNKKTETSTKKRKVLEKKPKSPKKITKKAVKPTKKGHVLHKFQVVAKHQQEPIPKAIKKPIIIKSGSITKSTAAISGPMGIKPYAPTKNEAYMCLRQIEHFKTILNIWKEQLMAEMNRTVQHMKNDAANFPDPVDRASQEEEFNLELKTRERERKLIKKIDEALEKIQGGDYGFCVDCGADIGIKRLEARPTASQCIECKTIAEIREKQTGG